MGHFLHLANKYITNNQTSGSATEDSLTRSEAELRTTIERHPNAPTAQELCLFFVLFVCLFDVTSICSGKGGRSTTDPLPAQVDPTLAIVLLLGCFHCLLVFLLRWITPHYRSTAVRLHVYLVFVKSIEQELKIQ